MDRWKLKFENKEIDILIQNNRPMVFEMNQDGKTIWEPLEAIIHESWVGKKDIELILCDEQEKELEIWTLKNAELDGKHIIFSAACHQMK